MEKAQYPAHPYPTCILTHTVLHTSVISEVTYHKQLHKLGGRHLPAASGSLLVA